MGQSPSVNLPSREGVGCPSQSQNEPSQGGRLPGPTKQRAFQEGGKQCASLCKENLRLGP